MHCISTEYFCVLLLFLSSSFLHISFLHFVSVRLSTQRPSSLWQAYISESVLLFSVVLFLNSAWHFNKPGQKNNWSNIKYIIPWNHYIIATKWFSTQVFVTEFGRYYERRGFLPSRPINPTVHTSKIQYMAYNHPVWLCGSAVADRVLYLYL